MSETAYRKAVTYLLSDFWSRKKEVAYLELRSHSLEAARYGVACLYSRFASRCRTATSQIKVAQLFGVTRPRIGLFSNNSMVDMLA